MDIDVNWLAISLATISSFIVGGLWYSKLLFVEPWRKLVKISEEDIKKGPGGKGWTMTAVGAFLQAYVLYLVTFVVDYYYTDYSWFTSAFLSGIILWIGMQLAMMLTHDSFEQRPLKLTVINAGNQLATLLVMGLIIGLLK